MPEVQNVGVADYAQYQPSQVANDTYASEYGMQPEVYDENEAQMRAASKSRLGATLLSSAVIAGLALWGGHAWGKKSAAKELEKANDAVMNYDKAKKALEEIEKAAEEGNNKLFGKNHCGNNLLQKIKDFVKPFKNAVKEAEGDAKEGTEKAADKAKDAAEELKEKATDANK